jgi:hypothetical protein
MDQDGQDHQIYTTRQEKIKKKVAQDWNITNFDPQAAFFNGASMEAIT